MVSILVGNVYQQAAQTQVSTMATGGTASVGATVSPATSQSTPAQAAGTSVSGANDTGPSQRLVSCIKYYGKSVTSTPFVYYTCINNLVS